MDPVIPLPVDPLDGCEPRPRAHLLATLRRIDGWGPLAWREVLGAWRLGAAVLLLEEPEAGTGGGEAGDSEADATLVIAHGLGEDDADATADWVQRQALAGLWDLPALAPLAPRTIRPGATVRATNACFALPPAADGTPRLCLRARLALPFTGMCIDPAPLRRLAAAAEAFAASLARPTPALRRHRLCVRRSRALRAALPLHGLCAFLASGSLIARTAAGAPLPGARPLTVPPRLRRTIDLGPLGRVAGLGIPLGVTALAGAPYHGKSTLLRAILAGADDHPPGDGRELVVADLSAAPVQAEDGRRVKDQDVSGFFPALPGQDPLRFTSERSSGATGMAATVLQAVAAGCRLLLVDEDTAASNFLVLDQSMRRLLGAAADGTTTLLECLPALARRGVSAVVVAGSSAAAFPCADRVLLLESWRLRDATRAARSLSGARHGGRALTVPDRHLLDQPDRLLGPRHFLQVDTREPERPRLFLPHGIEAVDLRRCGWDLDPALARGAAQAAAWCCRLAAGGCNLDELRSRWARHACQHGAPGLDPFHTGFAALPPWQLMVAVLERLSVPAMTCRPPVPPPAPAAP